MARKKKNELMPEWNIPEANNTPVTEEATPTTEETTPMTTATTEATTPETEEEAYVPPIYGYVAQKQAEAERANADAAELLQRYKTAQANGDSAIMALMQSAEPKRKEDEEKRLRNIAKIQAFGDILSAAARGYFAFRDKGARYVPNVPLNSPFKSIEDLNRLQAEYQQRKEKWDADMLQFNLGRERDKVAAAQALATAAQEDAANKGKALEDAWLKALEQEHSMRELGIREQGANARAAYREAGANARNQASNYTRLQAAAMRGTGPSDDEDDVTMWMYNRLNPWSPRDISTTNTSIEYDMNGREIGRTTRTDQAWSNYEDDEEMRRAEAETSGIVNNAKLLYDSGYSKQEALAIAVQISLEERGFDSTFINDVLVSIRRGESYKDAIQKAAKNKGVGF
ncbi:MAG: hypothetical protein J6C56_04800 [Alistipes sp.]|nr:hypothetical protein [Alistipes sp.]